MYIALEGGEGSGKGSVIVYLERTLTNEGYQVLCIREPGGTDVGNEIRDILLNKKTLKMSGTTETLLFYASRAQEVVDVIKPSLEKGKIVITDRSYLSSYAYQGYGRGVYLEDLDILTDVSIGNFKPNLVILLDVPPLIGLSRKRNQNEINRLDLEKLDFHERVRKGYLEMARQDPKRWRIINATLPIEEVHRQVRSVVLEALQNNKNPQTE